MINTAHTFTAGAAGAGRTAPRTIALASREGRSSLPHTYLLRS
jgi:hypothetical protein